MKTIGNGQHQPMTSNDIRILVVEDIAANEQVTCAILEHAGYATDVAVNGAAAIETLESKPYDMVLMDCCMPIMDGFEATRSIRAAGSRVLNPKIPIIALTALAMSSDRGKCLEAGMDDYVSKPVDPRKLIDVIERCLGTALGPVTTAAQRDAATTNPDPDTAVPERSEAGVHAGFEWPAGLLETVIDLFLDDAPLQIAQLQAACQSRDSDTLLAVSHKVRGSSTILGTSSISVLAKAVEEAAKQGDLERAYELTPKLVKELQRLVAELACAGDEEIPQDRSKGFS